MSEPIAYNEPLTPGNILSVLEARRAPFDGQLCVKDVDALMEHAANLEAEIAKLREALEVPRYWLRQLNEVSEACPDWSHCKMRVERTDYDTFRAALEGSDELDHAYSPQPHDPGGNCACGKSIEAHDPPYTGGDNESR
jgi:hypothetical protein